mmetsp:Transcript_19816/g.28047  ORF Transcript_19816/g.28047 Transcript_19816/m.28047 type:complete len:226 (-) Transcript_19816:201-878(-)
MNTEQPIRPYSRPEGSPLQPSAGIDDSSKSTRTHGCGSKSRVPTVRGVGGNERNSSPSLSCSKSSSITVCPQKHIRTKMSNHQTYQERRIILANTNEEEKCSLNSIEPMTDVYRFARQNEWDKVSEQCHYYSDEVRYVNPIDGTTALHLAIMSRTGYTLEGMELVVPTPAPHYVIEELLQIYPYAAMITCLMNSYTPLAYACLVSGDECHLDDAALQWSLYKLQS